MAIPSNRYVDIVSKASGGAVIKGKQLGLRVFTDSKYAPYHEVLNFTTAEEVNDFFVAGSEESKIAEFYFGFISKDITKAKLLQFVNWRRKDSSIAVYGAKPATVDVMKTSVVAGSKFKIKTSSIAEVSITIDLSAAADENAVATTVQTALKAGTGFNNYTVEYDDKKGIYVIKSNGAKDGVVTLTDDTNSPLKYLGFTSSDTVFVDGVDKETITDALNKITNKDNNFGSFIISNKPTSKEMTLSSAWTDLQNVEFLYMCGLTSSNYSSTQDLLKGYSSVVMTYVNEEQSDLSYILPSVVMGCIDYDKANAVENFMYQTDLRLKPSVTTTQLADTLDNLRINYFGRTQEAGRIIDFYQRGVTTIGNSGIGDISVHVNEQWMKSSIAARFLTMLLQFKIIPADATGQGIVVNLLKSVVDQAKNNGVIANGKTISDDQIAYINQLTGNSSAAKQVVSSGYYYMVTMKPESNEVDYLLIYMKRDGVKHISGSHALQ